MRLPLLLSLALFLLWAIFARWFYVCKIKNHGCCTTEQVATTPTPSTAPVAAVTPAKISFTDGDQAVLRDYNDFRFGKQSATLNADSNNIDFINKIAAYLKQNPQKNVMITGFYDATEKDVQVPGFANLGLARADAVKQKLVAAGLNTTRIQTEAKLVDNLANYINISARTVSIAEGIKQSGFTLKLEGESFASGSANFNPTPTFKADVDSLVKHQSEITAKQITITGHTDNTGKEEANVKLGKSRADAVKGYLVEKGVKMPITTDSKGSAVPIADNNTDEGKRLNRRVEIQFN